MWQVSCRRPSLKFRLPYLINVHQSINPFLLKSRGMKYCPSGKTPRLINACGSLNCSFIKTYVMLTTYISIKSKSASFMYLLFLVFQILLSFLLYYINKSKNYFFRPKNKIKFFVQSIFYLWYLQTILILSGDIETNPGPTIDNNQYLTICHWNLNSITTDKFIKFLFLEMWGGWMLSSYGMFTQGPAPDPKSKV